jgi:hypothetical protein
MVFNRSSTACSQRLAGVPRNWPPRPAAIDAWRVLA